MVGLTVVGLVVVVVCLVVVERSAFGMTVGGGCIADCIIGVKNGKTNCK